jgi:hypothetical protein
MMEIPVSAADGQVFTMLIDDEDYELISRFNWRAEKTASGKYRAVATVRAHRILVDYPLADHKNGNALDNRKENLRPATKQQNSANRDLQANNSTGFKGIYPEKKSGGYVARIQVNNKRIYLGYFKDPIEAAKAYDKAAREYFREFARTNFPEKEVA